jgi:hypothetical protein
VNQSPTPPVARRPSADRSDFGSYVRRLAERLHKPELGTDGRRKREFGTGDLAALRRLSPQRDTIPPEAYWRLLPRAETEWEKRSFWYALLPLLVRYPNADDLALGANLAHAGVSEARVERWLRREARDARADASRLFSRFEVVKWTEAGQLLRYWRERDRWRIADDFFRALSER